jgi:hypothetical protein
MGRSRNTDHLVLGKPSVGGAAPTNTMLALQRRRVPQSLPLEASCMGHIVPAQTLDIVVVQFRVGVEENIGKKWKFKQAFEGACGDMWCIDLVRRVPVFIAAARLSQGGSGPIRAGDDFHYAGHERPGKESAT